MSFKYKLGMETYMRGFSKHLVQRYVEYLNFNKWLSLSLGEGPAADVFSRPPGLKQLG